MKRSSRLLWLPAVAILLPSAFVALLGYNWFMLQRDASARRSAEAAQSAVDRLRADVESQLREAGESAASVLVNAPAPRAPFQSHPPCPSWCTRAFLFDASGTLLLSNDKAYAESIDVYRRATLDAGWQSSAMRIDALERGGDTGQAIDAAEELLRQSADTPLRPAVLLLIARLAASAGRIDRAERAAKEIGVCCAAGRDELGVAFPLYAAWQRARIYGEDSNGVRLGALIGELRDLVGHGYLGSESDVTTVTVLAARHTQRTDFNDRFAELIAEIEHVRDDLSARSDLIHLASAWVGQQDPVAVAARPLVKAIGRGSSAAPAALTSTADGHLVVMMLNRDEMTAWVNRWSAADGAFEIVLARPDDVLKEGSIGGDSRRTLPLFRESPDLKVAVRQRAQDPQAQRSGQLLMLAIVGVLVLTLLLAFLAARDVSRELRTASMRSAFVAGVTHELKTPLASIRLLAETLRLDRARPEGRAELLDTIVHETDRLGRLVDNVLSSSRVESGTRQYTSRVVSLTGSVRDAIQRVDYVVRQEGFHLIEHFSADVLPVRADPDALGQAILNLLGNALKYSETSRRIDVTVDRQGDHGRVTIADSGIGIAPDEQTRIFDAFYRTRDAVLHTTGAGLGLALVRHFVDAHGGRVELTSAPGSGSAFSIVLPLVESAPENGAIPTDVPAYSAESNSETLEQAEGGLVG